MSNRLLKEKVDGVRVPKSQLNKNHDTKNITIIVWLRSVMMLIIFFGVTKSWNSNSKRIV